MLSAQLEAAERGTRGCSSVWRAVHLQGIPGAGISAALLRGLCLERGSQPAFRCRSTRRGGAELDTFYVASVNFSVKQASPACNLVGKLCFTCFCPTDATRRPIGALRGPAALLAGQGKAAYRRRLLGSVTSIRCISLLFPTTVKHAHKCSLCEIRRPALLPLVYRSSTVKPNRNSAKRTCIVSGTVKKVPSFQRRRSWCRVSVRLIWDKGAVTRRLCVNLCSSRRGTIQR